MSETLRPSNIVASARSRDLLVQSRRGTRLLSPLAPTERDVIRLDSGDPDFMTPEPIRQALVEAVEGGHVHYGNPQGDLELRSMLAQIVSARAQAPYGVDQIVVTHGATGALAAAILGLVDQGDRVLSPEPTYSLYDDLVRLAGGEMSHIPTLAPRFDLDLDRVAAEMPGARLLILCNPCNPTGAVYEEESLREVAELAVRHNVIVLADEAYDRIVYDGAKHTSVLSLGLGELGVYVQSFSKTYAMTGWRLGFIAAGADLTPAFTKIHRTLTGPLNSAVQRAAIAALQLPADWFGDVLQEYDLRRAVVERGLIETDAELIAPRGTFYAFIRYPGELPSTAMIQLAEQYGVALRAGSEFGPTGEHHLRLAFSAPRDEVAEGVSRLAAAMDSLDGRHD